MLEFRNLQFSPVVTNVPNMPIGHWFLIVGNGSVVAVVQHIRMHNKNGAVVTFVLDDTLSQVIRDFLTAAGCDGFYKDD